MFWHIVATLGAASGVAGIVYLLDYFGIIGRSNTVGNSRNPKIIPLVVLWILTWGAVGFDYYDRHRDPFALIPNQSTVLVQGKFFSREVVPLDNFEYTDCKFDNVTFLINGTGPFGLVNNVIDGPINFRSENPAVNTAIGELYGLCAVAPWVTVNVPGVHPQCDFPLQNWLNHRLNQNGNSN